MVVVPFVSAVVMWPVFVFSVLRSELPNPVFCVLYTVYFLSSPLSSGLSSQFSPWLSALLFLRLSCGLCLPVFSRFGILNFRTLYSVCRLPPTSYLPRRLPDCVVPSCSGRNSEYRSLGPSHSVSATVSRAEIWGLSPIRPVNAFGPRSSPRA